MQSLVQMLNAFRAGRIDQLTLLLSVGRAMANAATTPRSQLALLNAEHAAAPLPPEVYRALHRAFSLACERQDAALHNTVPRVAASPTLPQAPVAAATGELLQGHFAPAEHVSGRGLDRILAESSGACLERADAMAVIEGIGSALAHAHGRNVVHGDLKPANVIISEAGDPQLVGFSLAFNRPRGGGSANAYASVEVCAGETPQPRDDVYSVACVAWESLTGSHPFGGRKAVVARDAGMKLDRVAPLTRQEFHALRHALAFDGARRTRSIDEFLRELRATSSTRRRSRSIIAAAAMVVVATTASAYLLRQPRAGADPPELRATAMPVLEIEARALPPAARASSAMPVATGAALRDCATCPLLMVLPAGRFLQGASGAGADEFEMPQHAVIIPKRIAMGLYEVTVGEFRAFAAAVDRPLEGCHIYEDIWRLSPAASWRAPRQTQSESHPVSCVSWSDATAYVEWLSRQTRHTYRLPSASEWEYAARAGSTLAQPWDDPSRACSSANIADRSAAEQFPEWSTYPCTDSHARAAPVGSFASNAFGLHDMLGNTFEWVQDCWNDDYRGAPTDGQPRLDGDCSERELRGGSWFTAPDLLRFSYRNRFTDDYRSASVGFRVVREVD